MYYKYACIITSSAAVAGLWGKKMKNVQERPRRKKTKIQIPNPNPNPNSIWILDGRWDWGIIKHKASN
jgi:hypothetical protein